MAKKKTRTQRKATEPTPREKLLERFEAACDEAAQARSMHKGLREEYRSNRKKRERVEQLLIKDLLRVYKHPDNPYRGWAASRKRYRELGHYPETMVTDLFGTHAEFERAAGLKDERGTSKVKLVTARYRTEKKIRDYAEECVMGSVGRWEKQYRSRHGIKHIIVGSDFHGLFVDPLALRVWLNVVKMVQPDGIVFNGDVVDFPEVGRYSQMPGAGNLSLQKELDFTRDRILKPTIAASPKSWRTYHIGNHEHRLIRYLADTAKELAELRCLRWDRLFEIEDMKLEMVFGGNWLAPRQKDRTGNVRKTHKIYYDSLCVLHGKSTAQNAWKVELERVGMSVTCGHTHRPGVFYHGTLANPNLNATHTGMMAGYAVGKEYTDIPDSANWSMGFCLFTIDTRTQTVFPQPIVITEDMATFNGTLWRATEKDYATRRKMWGENGDVTAHVRE